MRGDLSGVPCAVCNKFLKKSQVKSIRYNTKKGWRRLNVPPLCSQACYHEWTVQNPGVTKCMLARRQEMTSLRVTLDVDFYHHGQPPEETAKMVVNALRELLQGMGAEQLMYRVKHMVGTIEERLRYPNPRDSELLVSGRQQRELLIEGLDGGERRVHANKEETHVVSDTVLG